MPEELSNRKEFETIRTNTKLSRSAFSSIRSLCQSTKLPEKTVRQYLETNSTCTKFHPSKPKFQRLKVQSYRINEIWSVDLADMQMIADQNRGVRYLLVALDTLSRNLRVEAVRNKSADCTKNDLIRMIAKSKQRPEKIRTDDGEEFLGAFSLYCSKHDIQLYQTYNEKKVLLQKETFGRSKA